MHDAFFVLFDYYHSITNQRVHLKAILFHGNNNNNVSKITLKASKDQA